jgi:cytoskeletal protein CcmA (bactofilin family)
MAANVSIIGRTTRIRGRVTGDVDLEVQGFVDGEIAVGGDVTIDTQGMVGAGVRGRRVVVRGAVRGDLVGEEAVVLEDGARVVGDVRAPRVAIATGALVRGFVETGEGGGAPARTSRAQQPAARPIAAPVRVAAAPPPVQAQGRVVAAPPPVQAQVAPASAKPVERVAPPAHAAGGNNVSSTSPAPRRPPPPVIPALKKAKGQIAKKKER